VIAALAWLACTCRPDEAIHQALDEARTEALAEPEALADGWHPDAVLHLSPSLTDRVLSRSLAQVQEIRRRVPLGAGVVVKPRLTVQRVTVDGAGRCPTCLVATASFAGTVAYEAGILAGEVPLEATATVEVELEAVREARGFEVTAAPRSVRRVRLIGLALPQSLVARAEAELRAAVEQALVAGEPVPVLTLRDRDLPVRLLGVRVAPEGRGVRLELRSAAVRPGRAPLKAAPSVADWTLEASLQSAVWLGRREAFAAGPVAFDVVGVPESLSVDGDAFSLGLRLWRTGDATSGWWRDYRATGRIGVAGGEVALRPDALVEVAASPGAGRADPLGLAAQGRIRAAMTEALQALGGAPSRKASRPASLSVQTAAGRADLTVTEVSGSGDLITVRGEATVGPVEPGSAGGLDRAAP
jgi:hypothetical protein